MQSPQFLTYDEAREHLKQVDERRAKLRAECPPHLADVHARLFPPGERRDFPAGDGEGFVGSRKSLALSRRAEIQGWRRLDERPDPHALPPAPLAVGYLCVPADAQFIKALMRGILPAFWAKAVEPFAPVALTNCAAPGEVGH
jgi:hypothetical protein